MYCRKCGKKVEENSKFCPFCGCGLEGRQDRVSDTMKQNMQPQKADKNVSSKKWIIPVGIIAGIVVIGIAVFLGGKAVHKPEEVSKPEIMEEEPAECPEETRSQDDNVSEDETNRGGEEVNEELLSKLLYILGNVDYRGNFGEIMTLSQAELGDDFLYYSLYYAEDIMRGEVTPAEENWVLSRSEITGYLQNSLGSSECGGAFVISENGDFITIGKGNPPYVLMIEDAAVTSVEHISDTEIKVSGEMIYRQDMLETERTVNCQLTMVKNTESVWSGYTMKSIDRWEKGVYSHAETPEEVLNAYVYFLADAINTNNYDGAETVMVEGSALYNEQKTLISQLHNKGITEQVITCSAERTESIDATHARVISNEKIAVNYGDGTEKTLSQRYGYICELTEDGWLLTSIEKAD